MLYVIVMVTCWASEPAFFLGNSIADSPTEVVLSVFSYMEEDEGGGDHQVPAVWQVLHILRSAITVGQEVRYDIL